MLPRATDGEGVEPHAVETQVQLVRLAHAARIAILLFAQRDPDEVLAVDLRAAFLVASEAGRRMKVRGYGRIVNISSIAGRHRSPVSGVHYVSAKAGMIGLTRQMAFELAPFGVTVNVHCPSQTRTRMLGSTMSEDQQADLVSAIPVGRLAEIIDQVGPVLFLCSDASRYMTGSVIDVNGGQL